LQQQKKHPFTVVMKHGTMQVHFFSPTGKDIQQPHTQDELYIIAKGSSEFFRNGEIVSRKAGDVLFVPAQKEHRFLDFTEDFATWVVFY
jgi:mannose-6-phosphate isomerase-like protein (cupin superfamily)